MTPPTYTPTMKDRKPQAEGLPEPSAVETLEEALRRRDRGEPAWRYFDERARTHHDASRARENRPLAPPEARAALDRALSQPNPVRRRSLYVHIPFCEHLCSFCAFHRRPASAWESATYVEAVRGQIAWLAATPWAQGAPFDAVYIGGGTPTALPREGLAAIAQDLGQAFPLAHDCEFTVETRCADIAGGYLRTLRAAGVNRLSIGVQSFDTSVRRRVGRQRIREDAVAAVRHAADIGFDVVSIDLMYNLPGQTRDTWMRDVDTAFRLPIEGASVYCLIPYARSVLSKRIAAGEEDPLGGTDAEWERFVAAATAFESAPGWRPCSPVHYGRAGFERNVYNAVRAGDVDILAIGSGAGGRIGGLSYMNVPDVHDYTTAFIGDRPASIFATQNDAPAMAATRVLGFFEHMVLRDTEVPRDAADIHHLLDLCARLGVVSYRDGLWLLTPEGRFWSYTLGTLFAAALASDG